MKKLMCPALACALLLAGCGARGNGNREGEELGDNTVSPLELSEEEAALLNVKRGSPLLLFTDYQLDGEGKPLFFSKQVYCTERLKFYI